MSSASVYRQLWRSAKGAFAGGDWPHTIDVRPNPKRLLVLFGNQLFPNEVISAAQPDTVFMAESPRMCRRYTAHRHKLVLILSAMRSKADSLRQAGHHVAYTTLEEAADDSFGQLLAAHLDEHEYDQLVHFETESPRMRKRLGALSDAHGLERVRLESPMFLTSRQAFEDFRGAHKRLFMADFYRWQRKRLQILLDSEGRPVGGKWSYDDQNRKKLPAGVTPPALPTFPWTEHTRAVADLVDDRFAEHPGDAQGFWLPTTQKQAASSLDAFLEQRFASFGDYEDALSKEHAFVFHSVLSPLLNVGLLTPKMVIDRALAKAESSDIPLNSLEGFVRQIIGWREFVRGVWNTLPASHWEQNFWGHQRRLTRHWYEGTTEIPPLDDAIRRAQSTGYNHHIERLMVLGNLMLLCRVDPREAYRWFMEMFVDSADWVMAPNVYGMALFSEGGAFTTKPYICGSSYLRKMSDYGKGPWCDVVDGLYWSFIRDHREVFARNPRSKMMLRTLDRLDPERTERIFAAAETLVDRITK